MFSLSLSEGTQLAHATVSSIGVTHRARNALVASKVQLAFVLGAQHRHNRPRAFRAKSSGSNVDHH